MGQKESEKMWVVVLVLLLLGAQLNLTAIVPLQPGDAPPPWWVGGRLLWPFAKETNTLVSGNTLDTFTPLLAFLAAGCFLLAAAALLKWAVPAQWFPWLIVVGAVASIALQVIWFSGWAVLPLVVDVALLWLVFGRAITVASLR